MSCAAWADKIEAYADRELPETEVRAFEEHMRTCASCAGVALHAERWKRTVRLAGQRFVAEAASRARVQTAIRGSRPARARAALPIFSAVAAVVILALVAGIVWQQRVQRQVFFREVADLHTADLASANPVDVVSSDRHTVKPWFEGKVPFAFNLPELTATDFVLVGGRVTYVEGEPAAHLLFQRKKHLFSALIVRGQSQIGSEHRGRESNFYVQTWTEGELRFVVIGDASAADVAQLSELLRQSNLQ